MPKKLDKIQKEIWKSIKGKVNPRTKKPYTESDAWAISRTAYNKSQGGKK